jgi:outer membrane protein TolC
MKPVVSTKHFAMTLRRLISVGGLAAMLALGACVNQKKDVLSYRRILDGPDAHLATRPAELPTTLHLEDALRLADQYNDQIAISGEDYVQAMIERIRAAETFLPTLSFSPVINRQARFNIPSFGAPGSPNIAQKLFPQNTVDLPFKADVSASFSDFYSSARAAKTEQQQKALLLDLQSTTFLEVARAYYQVLESEASVRTLETSVVVQQDRVSNVTHRFQQGVAREVDVLQSQSDLAATRVQLTDARNDVIANRAMLAYLIGSTDVDVQLDDRFIPPADVDSLDLQLSQAYQNRQDLRAAAENVKAAAENVKAAIAQYGPSISINLNAYTYRETFPQDSWWNALATVNFPIFDEQNINQNVRAAYSRLRQAVSQAAQVQHKVNQDVRTSLANFRAGQQRLADLHDELQAATSAYNAAAHSFAVGTSTNLDVLTAQNSQITSNLQYNTENYEQKIAYLNLLRVTGRLTGKTVDAMAISATTQPDLVPLIEPSTTTSPAAAASPTTLPVQAQLTNPAPIRRDVSADSSYLAERNAGNPR